METVAAGDLSKTRFDEKPHYREPLFAGKHAADANAAEGRKPRKTCVVKTKVKVKGKVGKKTYTKETGGGGAQRAFVGSWLTGKKMPTMGACKQLFKEAGAAFAALQGVGLAKLKQEGAAGTVSHRAGGRTFRGLRSKRPQKKRDLANRIVRSGGGGDHAEVLRESLDLVTRTTLGDFGEVLPSTLRKEQAARAQRDIREVVAESHASLATCADGLWARAAAAGGLGLQQIQHCLPVDEQEKFHMDCFWMIPPAMTIASRVLETATKHPDLDQLTSDVVGNALEDAWEKLR